MTKDQRSTQEVNLETPDMGKARSEEALWTAEEELQQPTDQMDLQRDSQDLTLPSSEKLTNSLCNKHLSSLMEVGLA